MPDDTQIITKQVDESYWLTHNLSGRFWIAMILSLGLVIITILVFTGLVKLESNSVIAVYTGFSGSATGIIGIYMGQNSKPKAQETTLNPGK